MNYRLKTSKRAQEILTSLKSSTHITPNVLCRYAICLSLKVDDNLDFDFDNSGLEFLDLY